MEPKVPESPTPAAKPSKVEAIKLASEYLKVHMANEAFNGESHFTEDADGRPQVPRKLPAGRPRPPDPPQARGEGKSVLDDGPDQDAGREVHLGAVSGRR